MTLPEQDVAKGWQGRLVVDQGGARLGECTGIFADAATGVTEWLEVAVEAHRLCLVPALNAMEVGGEVRVAFTRAAVLAAPHVGDDTELTKRDDIVLYRHYGVHNSAAASPSLLPTGADVGEPKTADLSVPLAAGTDRDAGTQPQPVPPASVLAPNPALGEASADADTRQYLVLPPAPGRRPTLAEPRPDETAPVTAAPPPAEPAPVSAGRPPEPAGAGVSGMPGPERSGPGEQPRPPGPGAAPTGPGGHGPGRQSGAGASGVLLAALAKLAAAIGSSVRARSGSQRYDRLRAHPRVQHYRRCVTDPKLRRQAFIVSRDRVGTLITRRKRRAD